MGAQKQGRDILLVGLPLLACAIGLILLHWSFSYQVRPSTRSAALDLSNPTLPQTQRVTTDARLASQSDDSQRNVLELPEASLDFVGEWGGYTHTTIHSVLPARLSGSNPDRVSIVFGRTGGTFFIGSDLYPSPNNHLPLSPPTPISTPDTHIIPYQP